MDGVTGQASEAISVASSSSRGLDQGGIQEEAEVLGSGSGQSVRLHKTMFNHSMMLCFLDDYVVDDDSPVTLEEVLAAVGSRFCGPSGVWAFRIATRCANTSTTCI